MKKEKRSEVRRQEREVAIYCLRSTLPLHILKSSTTYYEKNCFVLNHSLNRHRVCRFLHATTGNNGNFDHSSDEGLTFSVAKETRSQEEGAEDRGIAIDHGVAVRH